MLTGYSNTISVTTSAALLLDLYPSAAAAYSVRLLRSAYSGSAMRVRRSSDNTESDIGFTALGNLDTTSLTSFCSGTNGFVTTWYDQSGNSQNVTQTTAANQPQIVSSGSIVLANAKPSLYFDGSNDVLTALALNSSVLAMNTHSSVYVHKVGPTWTNYYDVYERRRTSANETNYAPFGDISNRILSYWNGSSVASSSYQFQLNTQYINNLIGNTTNLGKLYANNSLVLTSTNKIGDSNLSPDDAFLWIGNWSLEYTEKYVQEVVLWASDQTSSISSINTNVNAYYNVY